MRLSSSRLKSRKTGHKMACPVSLLHSGHLLVANATRAEDYMAARGHNAFANQAAITRRIRVIVPIPVMVAPIPIWTDAGTNRANLHAHASPIRAEVNLCASRC